MGRLLKIGFPIAMQDGLIQVAFIIITIIANRRGLTDAAAVGIVEKVISFLFLVPSSMLSTVSALGAQNVGSRKTGAGGSYFKICHLYCRGIWSDHCHYHPVYSRKCSEPVLPMTRQWSMPVPSI